MASTGASLTINQPGKGVAKAPAKGPNYNSPLYNPSQTLSGKQLAGAATQLANTQINPVVQSLSQQIASNNKTSKTEQGTDLNYYLQLADAARQAVAQEQQVGSGLQTTLQGINAGTQSQLGQLGQAATGGALARMQALGLDAGQTSALQADLARQQGVGALNAQTGQTFGATQSANNASLGANTSAAVPLAGTEQIGGLARANALANVPINQKISDEQAQRGNLTATALGQLRTQERNYQVAQEGLGVKQATLQTTAANDRARNKIASTNATTAQQRAAITQQNDLANQELKQAGINVTSQNDKADQGLRQAALSAKKAGSTGAAAKPLKPLTANENNVANTRINQIMSAITTWQKQGMKNGKGVVTEVHPTDAQMRDVLGTQYASPLVEAAFDLLGYGSLRPGTAQALHNMGVRNTTLRGQPVTVKGPPNPATVGGGIGGTTGASLNPRTIVR
jgi:hypothetical protein